MNNRTGELEGAIPRSCQILAALAAARGRRRCWRAAGARRAKPTLPPPPPSTPSTKNEGVSRPLARGGPCGRSACPGCRSIDHTPLLPVDIDHVHEVSSPPTYTASTSGGRRGQGGEPSPRRARSMSVADGRAPRRRRGGRAADARLSRCRTRQLASPLLVVGPAAPLEDPLNNIGRGRRTGRLAAPRRWCC